MLLEAATIKRPDLTITKQMCLASLGNVSIMY